MRNNGSTLNCAAFCENCNVVMRRNFKGNSKLCEMLAELMAEEWNKRADDGK